MLKLTNLKKFLLSLIIFINLASPALGQEILRVPYYSQNGYPWCSVTSLSMFLKYYGYNKKPWEIAASDFFNLAPNVGIPIIELWFNNMGNYIEAATDENVSPELFYDVIDVFTLKYYLQNSIEANKAVLIGGWNILVQHAFLVVGVSQDSVYLNDPSGALFSPSIPQSLIKASMSWDDFIAKLFVGFPILVETITFETFNQSSDLTGSLFVYPDKLTFVNRHNQKIHILDMKWDGSNGYEHGYRYQPNENSMNFYPPDPLFGYNATLYDNLHLTPNVANSSELPLYSCVSINIKDMTGNELYNDTTDTFSVAPSTSDKSFHWYNGFHKFNGFSNLQNNPDFSLTEQKRLYLSDFNPGQYKIKLTLYGSLNDPGGVFEEQDTCTFNFKIENTDFLDPVILMWTPESVFAIPGELISFPLIIHNGGTLSDHISLDFYPETVDWHIYKDLNGDEIPDDMNEITETPEIGPGGSMGIVIQYQIDEGATIGSTEKVRFGAISQIDLLRFDYKDFDISIRNSIINIEPNQWYYGPVLVGSSENRLFIISNLGLGTLEVSNIDFTGTDANLFSIESGSAPFSLSPGENHYMEISFAPDSEGEKNAIMQISNNDPNNNPLNVQLSGTGTTVPHPIINIDTKYWDYGLVQLGLNVEKIFTIYNNAPPGSGQDLIGEMSIVMNNHNFKLRGGNTTFNLMPGASDIVTIGFHTYAEPGIKNAILRFVSNDPNNDTLDVPIWGTAFGPDIVVEPLSWDYDSVNVGSNLEKIFHVSNTGNGDLTINNMTITSDQFGFTSGWSGQSITLSGNSSTNIAVRFHPTSIGEKIDSLIIDSDDYDENRIIIILRGIGKLTSVNEISSDLLSSFTLSQNFPNPFNSETVIQYILPIRSHVILTVLNFLGHEIVKLIDGAQLAGQYDAVWNASDFPSGIYFYRLQAGDFLQTKKMLLIK